jgi:hypothetical protein
MMGYKQALIELWGNGADINVEDALSFKLPQTCNLVIFQRLLVGAGANIAS